MLTFFQHISAALFTFCICFCSVLTSMSLEHCILEFLKRHTQVFVKQLASFVDIWPFHARVRIVGNGYQWVSEHCPNKSCLTASTMQMSKLSEIQALGLGWHWEKGKQAWKARKGAVSRAKQGWEGTSMWSQKAQAQTFICLVGVMVLPIASSIVYRMINSVEDNREWQKGNQQGETHLNVTALVPPLFVAIFEDVQGSQIAGLIV